MFNFKIINKDIVEKIINNNINHIFDVITEYYKLFHSGKAVNPKSCFLRFPNKPNARIIALPCCVEKKNNLCGIKWVSSFPDNINHGFQRASAVFILNNGETGYPEACIESSYISAVRTAVSAIIAAEKLHHNNLSKKTVAIVGGGFISRTIIKILQSRTWSIDKIAIYDIDMHQANKFVKDILSDGVFSNVVTFNSLHNALRDSDTIFFATTALQPYVTNNEFFLHSPVVINVSLRDLSEEIIINSDNYVDDVNHVLDADTSVHLAFKKLGNYSFIKGNIANLLDDTYNFSINNTRIFSPMGMGILDLGLADFIYSQAVLCSLGVDIPNFFGNVAR